MVLRRVVRLVAVAAAVVAAIAIAGLLILHTNPVQSRVLQWSVGELERRFDLDLTADDLHYNLAARRVTLTNVRLASVGHDDDPFFAAQNVTVKLPWAVFAGRLRFDDVSIDTGSVTIVRDARGVSNLPPGRGQRDPDAPARRIDIRGVTIQRLDFLYRDVARDVEIRTPGIRTDLDWDGATARGALAIESESLIRVRERNVVMKPVAGVMSFNGSDVGLDGVVLDTTEGTFRVTGDIVRALDRPTLDLGFEGTTDLAVSDKWAASPITVSGAATMKARMTGPPSSFVLDSVVAAADAVVGSERGVTIEAESRLTLDRVTVSRSSIRPRTGGEIQATVDVPFSSELPWWIKASYRDVDAAAAFRLAEVRPLPFGAALSGNALIEREPGRPFRLEVRNTSVPRTSRDTAPLEGTVTFVIDGNRWRAEQQHRMGATLATGTLGGTWNRQSAAQSTFALGARPAEGVADTPQPGTLIVTSGSVDEATRYAALFGLATPQIVRDIRGPMFATVVLGGTFVQPRFTGHAESAGVEVPALGTVALQTDFDASAQAVEATGIEATLGTTSIAGDVRADLVTRQFGGKLLVESPNAADLLEALPQAARLQGPLSSEVTFGGTVDTPDIVADVRGDGLTLAEQPIESLRARVRVVDDGLNIESLSVRQAGAGELRGTGRYEWGSRTYTVDLDAQDLVWRGTLARLGDAEARIALKFSGSGPIDQPAGQGVVEFAVSGGVAGELIDRGVANVRLNGDTALVTGHLPSLGALITTRITPREPFDYEAVVVMHRIDLAPMVRLAGLRQEFITGQASLSAHATGVLTDVTASNVFVNLQEVTADASGVPINLGVPSRIAWDGSALSVDNLDMSIGSGRLLASGRLGQGGVSGAMWESAFKGELGDLVRIGRSFGVPPELEGFGPVAFEWRSQGGLDRSAASLRLDGGSLAWGTLPALRELVLDATYDGAALNVTQFTGRWQDGSIEGTASIPRAVLEAGDAAAPLPAGGPGFAKVRVSGMTASALAPWVSSDTLAAIDGRLSATLDARLTRASLDGLGGTLVVDEADFVVAGVGVKQTRPAIVAFDGGVVTARDVEFSAGGSPLTVTGTVRLAPPDQQTLDLSIQGMADLQLLSAFSPAIATDGEAKVAMGIGGTISAPVLNGRLDVSGAEVAIREPRIVISELTGTIAMDGQRVVFDAFNGTANGGRLTLDGGFLLDGFTPSRGGLVIVLDRAAIEYPAGLQSEANAILTLAPGPTAWSLTGEVSVERSAYTQPISVAALIAARASRPPSVSRDRGWLEQMRLNLWVTTLQDLVVDNNYGRLELGGAVRVLGTVAEPVLAGRLSLNEGGEVYLAGNTFHVERGSISFTNPFRIEPEFDIELRTLVSGADLTLTIDGPLDRLRTDVRSSDPTIDSREAMGMIFGGLEGEDAVTLLSSELLGGAGRALGLDTLRVQRGFDLDEFRADPGLIATETDPSTRLTLSKRVRPDVELILSQSLRESGGLTAVVSYKPRRHIEIRAVSRDNLDRSIALRHEITFGGAGTPEGGRAAEPPAVTTVTISGSPERPADELISRLELGPGDDFDFHRWQQDIDRLRAVYHDEGHFEVRVRGTRTLSDDTNTVALDYEITPGPVTDLVIEGHPLDARLEEEIRQAWRRTIFDRFLLEEIQARVTRHLLQEGMIGSTVKATVAVSTPERKQILVTVAPGTEVSSREVRFSGNTNVESGRLSDALAAAGLELDAWLDPAGVADALEIFYRSEGFLSATVNVDRPVIEGSVGVLPIVVAEGPRFLIGSVEFQGVSPDRLAAISDAARLAPGTPYTTAVVDAARDRVRELYGRAGFNAAQTEIDASSEEETARVHLSVAVLEGLQQVLREVTTQGATRTEDDVIQRALRLRLGTPVSLAEWSQARKRLYDTNVFRQVDIEPVPIDPSTEDSAAGIQPVRAVVRVVEYPVWRLRYGTQFTDERTDFPDVEGGDTRLQSLGVLADLQNQNLFGRAITAGIAGRYERDRQAASLFTSNSSFFGLPIRSGAFVFGSRQRLPSTGDKRFIDERGGISAEQRWRPFRTSEVIWSYRFERSHTFDPAPTPGDLIPFDETATSSGLNAAMFFDRRDDPSDPSRGWFAAGNWEQGLTLLGSDSGTGKILLQQSVYRGVGRLIVAARAQLGTSYGGEGLIFSERFTLGGATTVRGYAENSLGPRDFADIPVGGDALLNFNGELRFPVRGWVQGVAFVDAGNVFATRLNLSLGDLAVGYGVGLRLASPFAMLRIDFGMPASTISIDRRANQLKSGRWYFGIGHIF